jgi:hypothetical protein
MRSVLEKTDTQLNTAKAEGFRIFHEILPLIISGFAWLGSRPRVSGARGRENASVSLGQTSS